MPPEPEFGVPQVNVHKRTTKVNLTIVAAVVVFLGTGAAMLYWIWRQG